VVKYRPAYPFWRIGHRGAAALEPENTLRSIEAALKLGVEMVEEEAIEPVILSVKILSRWPFSHWRSGFWSKLLTGP
jgi:hypothetical protein